MMSNPKFLMKAAYMSVLMFGAFHLTKLSLAVVAQKVLSKMGKP